MRFHVLISLPLLISVSQAAPASSDHGATSEIKPFTSAVTSSDVELSLSVQTQISSVAPFETTVPATQQTGLNSIKEHSAIHSDASIPTQAAGSAGSTTPLARPTGSTRSPLATPAHPNADTSAINSGNIEASQTPITSSPPSVQSGAASAVGEPQSAARSQTSHLVGVPSSVTVSSNEAPSPSSGTAPPAASASISIIEDLICGGRCMPCNLFGMRLC